MFDKLVFAARMVLGIFYLLSGLNWFFGFLPLPHLGMPEGFPIKHAVVAEMIDTGWMFQSAKLVEIAFGIALLANRAVPLMLLVAFPIGLMTFMLDALILDDLWRWLQGSESGAEMWAAFMDMVVGGLCVFLIHVWLMLCYFDYYRPLLAWSAPPKAMSGCVSPDGRRTQRILFFSLGWLALALQTFNLIMFLSLIGK